MNSRSWTFLLQPNKRPNLFEQFNPLATTLGNHLNEPRVYGNHIPHEDQSKVHLLETAWIELGTAWEALSLWKKQG